MAYIESFEVKSFKGIKTLSLPISGKVKCPVITLVGLNESGKTTVLEALSHFLTRVGTISIDTEDADETDVLSLVPISKKANFTGEIQVAGKIVLEDSDHNLINDVFSRGGYKVDVTKLPKKFLITRKYKFRDGDHEATKNTWSLNFFCKSNRAKYFRKYQRPSPEELASGKKDFWLKCALGIEKQLPSIAYFPTFLVEIPDRIYLSEKEGEQPSQSYYREVLQDVLNSLDEDLDLQKHLVDRVERFREQQDHANWLASLFSSPAKGQIDTVVQKISSAISREVIGSWKNIFNRPISAKMITLDWNVDTERDCIPYISFGISDGESKYQLHERSLGFRWFFLFLLFTRFKRSEDRPTLFLFDEPAANLHARAQGELLESFDKIIENRNQVIYSTHSAHMINPKWISAAFIVENKAINYESDEVMHEFASPPTSIVAVPYRQFVASSANRTSYFQPILEKLDFVGPRISMGNRVLVTEGISDFHAFSFYGFDLLRKADVRLLPGLGDTGHDAQIASLLSDGAQFLLVLDDDASGKRGAQRYREKWFIDEAQVATVGELDAEFSSKKLESLLSGETLANISKHFDKQGRPSKKEIRLYFAEANAGNVSEQSEETRNTFRKILRHAIEKLDSAKGENVASQIK